MALRAIAQASPDFALLDSGATSHMFPSDFADSRSKPCSVDIQLASKYQTMEATKIGDIGLLKDVLFIEEIAHPLVSIMKLTDNGFSVNFKSDGAEISLNGIVLIKAMRKDNLFLIKLSSLIPSNPRERANVASHTLSSSIEHLHERLAHSSLKLIQKAIQSA
jgi:hypothetical protein